MENLDGIEVHEGFHLNLVKSHSKNYRKIQKQLFDSITRHLPPESVTATHREWVDGAVNLAVFIRSLNKGSPIPMPADVFLSHGLADKRYILLNDKSTRTPFLNSFSHALVPGNWMKRRLLEHEKVELTEEQIHVVGWPRLDDLLIEAAEQEPDQRRWMRKVKILWAPSHDFRRYGPDEVRLSSYPEFEDSFERIGQQRRFETRVSLHPRNRPDKKPTSEALLWADVVISDFGTMVYEAWALGKPVIFPTWILQDRLSRFLPQSAEAQLFEQSIGLHPASFDEMLDMLKARPTLGEEVRSFMDDYLDPTSYGRSGHRIAEKLVEIHRRDHGGG